MKGKYNIADCLTKILSGIAKVNGCGGNILHGESKIHVLSLDFEVL